METNQVLEELWQIKDDLAREAGYDNARFFENLRQWAAEHPHTGGVARDARQLRQLAGTKGSQRIQSPAAVLNDKLPGQDS